MKSLATFAATLALISAGVVLADPAAYDGAGRVVAGRPAAKPADQRDVQAPQSKPRGLLLPAVQKAAPDPQKPQARPDRKVSEPPLPVGKTLMVVRKPKDTDPTPPTNPRRAVLTVRKAGEGQ